MRVIRFGARVATSQVGGETFQGHRKLRILHFPKRMPCVIFSQQADRWEDLSETHLWAALAHLDKPLKQTRRELCVFHSVSPIRRSRFQPFLPRSRKTMIEGLPTGT